MFFRGAKSSAARIDNYKAKMRAYSGTGTAPDYMAPVNQFKLNQMYQQFQRTADEQAGWQINLKRLLCSAGEAVIKFGSYFAFANEMYGATMRLTGVSMQEEAEILIAKWTARGLTEAVLQGIRTDIFSVTAPAA